MADKQSDPFYHSAAWKRARAARLMLDHYMCAECMEEWQRGERMRPQRATMVHHLQPRTERPDLALEISNLRSLCDMHHNREHPEKGGRGAARAVSMTVPMRVIKIED